MKIVRKANKELTIEDSQLAAYLAQGFDEINEKGQVVQAAPRRMYTAAEYNALKEKLKTSKRDKE